MKILLIAYFFPPDNNGGVQRPLSFYKFLKEKGHEVSVITHGHKTDISTEVYRLYDLNKSRIRDKLLLFLVRSVSKLFSFIGIYIPYYIMWYININRYIKKILEKEKPDIIIGTYPPVECLYALKLIVKKTDIPIVCDYRDPFIIESAEQHYFNKFPYLIKKYKKLEEELTNKSALILGVSPVIVNHYTETLNYSNAQLLPNGFDVADLDAVNANSEKYSKFNSHFSNNKISIVYTGTLTFFDKERCLNEFFEAIISIINSKPSYTNRMELLFYGDFSKKDFNNYKTLIDAGLLRVFAKVKRDESLFLQSKADILLLVTDNVRRSVATGKIFEYLFTEKFILGLTKNTYAEEIINKSNSGACADPRSEKEIKDLILKILTDFESLRVSPNKMYIESFNRKTQVSYLENLLNEVIAKS